MQRNNRIQWWEGNRCL